MKIVKLIDQNDLDQFAEVDVGVLVVDILYPFHHSANSFWKIFNTTSPQHLLNFLRFSKDLRNSTKSKYISPVPSWFEECNQHQNVQLHLQKQ